MAAKNVEGAALFKEAQALTFKVGEARRKLNDMDSPTPANYSAIAADAERAAGLWRRLATMTGIPGFDFAKAGSERTRMELICESMEAKAKGAKPPSIAEGAKRWART